METSSLDRNATTWVCSICGQRRQSPFATPCTGQARGESCRTCGETLATPTPVDATALRIVIGHHLI